MLLRKASWLIPISLLISSFGYSDTVKAQTIYPINTEYNILATAKDLTPNIQQIFLSGSNTNAPYGLSEVNSLTYSQTNFTTGEYSFSTDPATFGLKDQPLGYVTLFGNNGDKLFGTQSGTGSIDFNTLTVNSDATVKITGGEGKFTSASGTLISSQVQPFGIQIGVDLKGETKISGSFQTVPEPGTSKALLGLSLLTAIGIIKRQKTICKLN